MNNDAQDGVVALERELREERRAREALVEASVRLNSLLNLPELLHATMNSAEELLAAETSCLMLLDETANELVFEVATGEPGEGLKETRMPADRGIAGWVVQNGQPTVVNAAADDPRFYEAVDRSSGFNTRSILAVPLKSREHVIGVVEVINKRGGQGFTERDVDLATGFAAQAAVAIENARLYRKLADAVVESRMSYRL